MDNYGKGLADVVDVGPRSTMYPVVELAVIRLMIVREGNNNNSYYGFDVEGAS